MNTDKITAHSYETEYRSTLKKRIGVWSAKQAWGEGEEGGKVTREQGTERNWQKKRTKPIGAGKKERVKREKGGGRGREPLIRAQKRVTF